MKNILLVEDDYQLGEVVKAYLEANRLNVTHVETAQEALDIAKGVNIDCIVLDLNLPDEDGLVLLRKIRMFSQVPVFVCSARGSVEERITGLEFGADDYISKPFSSKELFLRIQRLIERDGYTTSENNNFAWYSLDMERKGCINNKNNEFIPLTANEFYILRKLSSRIGRVCSRAELLDATASIEGPENNRAIDICISRLRKKIEPVPKDPKILKTAVGFGYYLDTSVI